VTPVASKVVQDIDGLVNAWCDRRSLRALREILAGWPLVSGLTDDWGRLLKALERVRAFGRDDLTDEEAVSLDDVIHDVQRVIDRR
jgi:hypothetical protein